MSFSGGSQVSDVSVTPNDNDYQILFICLVRKKRDRALLLLVCTCIKQYSRLSNLVYLFLNTTTVYRQVAQTQYPKFGPTFGEPSF